MATALAVVPEPEVSAALLGEREVSETTGVSISTLRYLWLIGMGPAYTEDHGRIRVTLADLQKWQAIRRESHARLMASYGRTGRE